MFDVGHLRSVDGRTNRERLPDTPSGEAFNDDPAGPDHVMVRLPERVLNRPGTGHVAANGFCALPQEGHPHLLEPPALFIRELDREPGMILVE